MSKINCWEFKKCGREPGGINVKESGICPASVEKRANGIHGGKNGGRCCWAVMATQCSGGNTKEKTYANKLASCISCEFYKVAYREEWGKPTYKSPTQISEIIALKPVF